jgi:hypothetical protein
MTSKQKTGSVSANVVLSGLLSDLGWSINRAAREINAYMGPGYIARSSVGEWINNGRVPREPLPTVVAYLLSNALGRQVTVADLWGPGVKKSTSWVPADHGQHYMRGGYPGVLGAAYNWITNVGKSMDTDRRKFMAVSGAALTAFALTCFDTPAAGAANVKATTSAPDAVRITPGILDALETTISGLRKLDDVEGGNPNSLRLAHHHFRTVAGYVRSGNVADSHTRHRLLEVWAQLAWLSGWMAFDAGEHGLAQRYLRTGLQITHVTENRELSVELLGCLVHQAIFREQPRDASELAHAAIEMSKNTSPAVQALATCWHANAQAANGNSYACYAAIDNARSKLNTSGALENRPEWLYWFHPDTLQSRLGWSLLNLAQTQANPSTARRVLEQAETIVAPYVVSATAFPRTALYHGAWLARSYVWRDELEQAVATGAVCLELLQKVHSPRCNNVLHKFTNELKQHRGARSNRRVTELTAALQT